MAPKASQRAEDYRFWVDENVRYSDVDGLGHVNNIAYAVYTESGRSHFLRETGIWVIGSQRQSVIVDLALHYHREILMPAKLRIGVNVLDIGRKSFVLGTGIFVGNDCKATSETVAVGFDMTTRKSAELFERERAALQPYLLKQ